MNTSPIYMRAAEQAVADAVKSRAAHKSTSTEMYSLGIDAVRNCGYQSTRVVVPKGRYEEYDPVEFACYAIASIPNQEIAQLLKVVNPSIPGEQRIRSLMSSATFAARVSKCSAAMKRKMASICADILLSYASHILVNKSIHLHFTLNYRSKQLIKLQHNALHEIRKKDAVINSLFEWRARTMKGVEALVNQVSADVRVVDEIWNPAASFHSK